MNFIRNQPLPAPSRRCFIYDNFYLTYSCFIKTPSPSLYFPLTSLIYPTHQIHIQYVSVHQPKHTQPMSAVLELPIDPKSTIKALATRTFGRTFHTFYTLDPEYPQTPDAYMCWIAGCHDQAEELGLRNIGGNIIPFIGCRACYQKYHGVVSDDDPPLKNPLLTPDGEPVEKEF